ncbi:MAG: ATP synthase F1 subunit gamma [Syntrophaceticus sp.]|nr:ATP synthase F1 subunit gamma [Syntrophaceticus sp.]HBI27829.1 ATP synthase F1 subunit gamma [Peptococcaceae bacterium]
MAEQTREIKRRIRSIQNTEQITKAMQMVAAARLRRAEERVVSARPYSEKIDELIKRIAENFGEISHPFFRPRERHNVGYVVFTSDRGLCGGYNSHIIHRAELAMAQDEQAGVIIVGTKGRDYFRRRNVDLLAEFLALGEKPAVAQAEGIARTLVELYKGNIVDEVNLVYTEYISTGKQQPVVYKLLPLVAPEQEEEEERDFGIIPDYIIEPNPQGVLDMLLPRFINAVVFRALQESKASEEAVRMIAMSSASENAKEMIDDLSLLANKLRQAGITSEISEIVSGAGALEG